MLFSVCRLAVIRLSVAEERMPLPPLLAPCEDYADCLPVSLCSSSLTSLCSCSSQLRYHLHKRDCRRSNRKIYWFWEITKCEWPSLVLSPLHQLPFVCCHPASLKGQWAHFSVSSCHFVFPQTRRASLLLFWQPLLFKTIPLMLKWYGSKLWVQKHLNFGECSLVW